MRKFFRMNVSLLLLSMFTLLGAANSQAQTPTQMEFGVTYDIPQGGTFEGVFDITETSILSVYVTGDGATPYSSPNEEETIYAEMDFDKSKFGSVPKEIVYNVEPGTWYYKVEEVSEPSSVCIDYYTGNGGSETPEPGESINVVFGTWYDVPMFGSFSGTVEMAQAGTLNITVGYGGQPGDLNDANGQIVDTVDVVYGGEYGIVYVYDLAAGTYTYNVDGGFDPFQIMFEGEGGNGDTPGTGGEGTVVTFGTWYDVPMFGSFSGTVEMSQAGTLNVTVGYGGQPGYLNDANGQFVDTVDVVYGGEYGIVYVYDLAAGTYTYNVDGGFDPFQIMFEAGESGPTEPDQPGEIPAEYSEMQFDTTYNVSTVGGLMLYFTAPANGTLTATQYGSSDSYLFASVPVYNDEFGWNLNTPIPAAEFTGNDPYIMTYGLTAGKTYYVLARMNAYDTLSSIEFNWQADGETGNVISLNEETAIATGEVYTFTAPASGILTIETNQYSTGIANIDGTQGVIYTNQACTNAMPSVKTDDGTILNGWQIQVAVEAGTMYYLTNPTLDPLTVYLTLDENASTGAKITLIEPTPGTAYNVTDFRYSWNIITSPSDTSAEAIEMVYTDKNGQQVTVSPISFEFAGGAFRVNATEIVKVFENDLAQAGTYVTFNFTELKAGGSYITEYVPENGNLTGVTIGENGYVTISFLVDDAITLISSSLPNPFYQSWTAGDPAAKGTLVYSGNVVSVDEVSVIEGQVVQGGQSAGDDAPASVTIPASNISISGNTVTIDFAGVDMSSLPAGRKATVWVQGVMGENGLAAEYNNGQNTVLTEYVTVTEGAAPAPETPGTGIIAAVIPADGSDIPGFLDGTSIQVKFNEDPAYFTFSLYTEEGEDGFAGWWDKSSFTLNEDGYYEKVFGFDYKIYEGNVGSGIFTVYADGSMNIELGRQTVTWNGTSPALGSSVEVIDIFPANDGNIDLNADGSATIEITFSAPVSCTAAVPAGFGAETTFQSLTANDDETVWTITVPANLVAETYEGYGALKVIVRALDGLGEPVYYEGMNFIALSYEINGEMTNGEDFNVSLEGQTETAPVKSFTVSAARAISANDYNMVLEDANGEYITINPYRNITVYNAEGEKVTTAAPVAEEAGFNGTVTFETPINAPGEYSIYFPYAAFSIGEETSGGYSMEKTVEFTVAAGSGYEAYFQFYGPADFDFESEMIIMSLTGSDEDNLQDNIVDGMLTVSYEETPAGYLFAVPDTYELYINAPQNLVADVDYKITPDVVVEGFNTLSLDLYEGADKAVFEVLIAVAGVEPPADTYATTFAFVAPEDFDFENDLMVMALTGLGEDNLQQGIENGMLTVYYDETPAGYLFAVPATYVVTITAPEGLVPEVDYLLTGDVESEGMFSTSVDLYAGANDATFTVTITAADKTGITGVVSSQEGRYDVYDMTGVRILSTDNAAELQLLENGLYIVNGKKVLVRK